MTRLMRRKNTIQSILHFVAIGSLLAIVFCGSGYASPGEGLTRRTVSFDQDWRFLRADAPPLI